MTQQPYGQPAYPPAPPYQQPPAPQQYAPQYPQAPQQPYPAAPPQQYAPPAYGPPQPPAQPLATGNLEDFYNQPSSASGPSISWTDKQGSPKPIGTTYVGVVARDVTNADVQQQTDFRTQAPLFYRDGRPKFAMKVPLKGVTVYDPAGNVLPNTDFPEGEGTWFVKGQARDELVRAMAEAGREGSPTSGATLVIRLVQRRPSGPGMNPANIVQVQYHPGAAGTGAPSPAPVPAEVPQAPQVAYQQPAPQQQYAPPQVPAQPAYQPPVQQVPVQQPAPQGAPQPPQGLSAEQQDLLARLTAQQAAGTPAA